MVMLPTVNLVLTKRSSDMDPLGAVELAIGGGGDEIGGFDGERWNIIQSC